MGVEMNGTLVITSIATAYIDEHGYLLPSEGWDRNVACLLSCDAVPGTLTEDHWRIVDYLRRYYVEFGFVPPVRKLCRITGFTLRNIYELFPIGLARGACKVAGIPSMVLKSPCVCFYP